MKVSSRNPGRTAPAITIRLTPAMRRSSTRRCQRDRDRAGNRLISSGPLSSSASEASVEAMTARAAPVGVIGPGRPSMKLATRRRTAATLYVTPTPRQIRPTGSPGRRSRMTAPTTVNARTPIVPRTSTWRSVDENDDSAPTMTTRTATATKPRRAQRERREREARSSIGASSSGIVSGTLRDGATIKYRYAVSAQAVPLEIRLLGPLEVLVAGDPIVVDTRKALAIVALVAAEGRPFARDELAAMFWPDADDEAARGALRRTLSTLRTAI